MMNDLCLIVITIRSNVILHPFWNTNTEVENITVVHLLNLVVVSVWQMKWYYIWQRCTICNSLVEFVSIFCHHVGICLLQSLNIATEDTQLQYTMWMEDAKTAPERNHKWINQLFITVENKTFGNGLSLTFLWYPQVWRAAFKRFHSTRWMDIFGILTSTTILIPDGPWKTANEIIHVVVSKFNAQVVIN